MKTKNCLWVFVLFFLANSIAAQEKIIKIDFLNPSYPKSLDYDTTYVFKIININRYLYEIEDTVTKTDYNTTLPSIFKGIKLPALLNLALPAVDSLNKNITKENNYMENLSPYEYISRKIESYKEELEKISQYEIDINNIKKRCNTSYDAIEKELIDTTKATFKMQTNDRTAQAIAIESKINAFITEAEETYLKLKKYYRMQETILNTLIRKNNIALLKNDIQLPKKTNDLNSNYAKILMAKDSLTFENTKINNSIKKLQELVATTNTLVSEIKKIRSENKIQLLINNYNTINKANYSYVLKPIKVKTDEIKISIKTTTEQLLPCNTPNDKTLTKTLKVKGGTKIDFSTGLFFNFGNNDFIGRDLYYANTTNDSKTIRAKDAGNNALLGIGALMHIYKRSDKDIKLAFSPGLSASSGFDFLNFHLGLSAIFGKKNRLVITGGITLRESVILDRNYKLDTLYLNTDLPEAVPAVNVFPRIGQFISVTYNFSKFK